LGRINYFLGNYTKSIQNFEEALDVYIYTADNLYQAYTLTDIGNSYT